MPDSVKHTDPTRDRLTRIANSIGDALAEHPEYRDGDKAIVMMDDGHFGGIGIFGYEDDTEAITDLLIHLKAMFEANGKGFDIAFLGPTGVDRGWGRRERG